MYNISCSVKKWLFTVSLPSLSFWEIMEDTAHEHFRLSKIQKDGNFATSFWHPNAKTPSASGGGADQGLRWGPYVRILLLCFLLATWFPSTLSAPTPVKRPRLRFMLNAWQCARYEFLLIIIIKSSFFLMVMMIIMFIWTVEFFS